MALVQVPIELVDAPSTAISPQVYIRCKRQADESTRKTQLYLTLLHGSRMWDTHVSERQKPSVLDCTPTEYLDTLERSFTPSITTDSSRFTYKWSSAKGTLTLMEKASSGFAMKYTSLSFTETKDDSQWQEVLHDVVQVHAHALNDSAQRRKRVQELENVLSSKDSLLTTALASKQRLEDELFTKFCAVLNAKKQEIERLQRELNVAYAKAESGGSHAVVKKRAVAKPARKKALGARIRKDKVKEEEEEEEEDDEEDEEEEAADSSSESGDGESGDEDEDDVKPSRSKTTRGAINAYSQLASQVNLSSQVCAAADVLDELDEIMKTEVEQDEQQSSRSMATANSRKRVAKTTVPESVKKIKVTEPVKPAVVEKPAAPKAKSAPPPAPKQETAIDSEEEDILDMLS